MEECVAFYEKFMVIESVLLGIPQLCAVIICNLGECILIPIVSKRYFGKYVPEYLLECLK